MKRDVAAALFHVALVVFVYAVYGAYPPHAVPVPYFDFFTYAAGAVYGAAGVLTLRAYVRNPLQPLFNMAVLWIVAGGFLFIAEGIGNAG